MVHPAPYSGRMTGIYRVDWLWATGATVVLALFAGCKNSSGSGSPAPLSFPFSSSGPTATGGSGSAAAAAGTAAAATVSNQRDPLLGMGSPAPPSKNTNGNATPPVAGYSPATPPVPSPTGATSPAALTTGQHATLDSGLRMPIGGTAPVNQPASGLAPAIAPAIRLDQPPGSSGFTPATGVPGPASK